MRNKLTGYFIIGTFVTLYLIVSIISTIHVIKFFELSNPKWLAISLALAFEVGAAASLASLIILDKMNKFLVWSLFIILTCMQAMGNTYYAYTHLTDFRSWSELFGLIEEDIIYQKRLLSIISGAILPLVSLGFIKSLVDYIKPSPQVETEKDPEIIEPVSEVKEEPKESNKIEASDSTGDMEIIEAISKAIDAEEIGNSEDPKIESPGDLKEINSAVHIDPMRIK